MPRDLRSFLADLEQHHPGELVRIRRPVDPNWEIAAVLRRFRQDRARYGYPALLFEQVIGFDMPVLTNTLGARSRLAAMLGTSPGGALAAYMQREEQLIPPTRVPTGPVKEHILTGDHIDLHRFPIPWHAEQDGGPYITGDLTIMRNPRTGALNAGCYRIQPQGPRRAGISLGTHSHAFMIMRENERQGRDTEVVIALGLHPAAMSATQSRVPDYVSELAAIGGLLGEPLELTAAETVAVPVPARAEIVLEGRLLCGQRGLEGPLGEYTWYYGPQRNNPVLEITAITHRQNPIFFDLNNAYHEHVYTSILPMEAHIFRHVRRVLPSVRRVRLPESGCCRFLLFVQIKKEIQGEGTNAALIALGADPFLKLAVVVDDDVDIDDDEQVWWAVLTRSQASRNWFFLPNAQVQRLLPISHNEMTGGAPGQLDKLEGLDTKVGIDATKPLSYLFSETQDVRRADWEHLDLAAYLETHPQAPVGTGRP